MSRDTNTIGRVFAVLGLTHAEPVAVAAGLHLDQYEAFQTLIKDTAAECRPPAYHPGHRMWFAHQDTLAQKVLSLAPDALGNDDADTLKQWLLRGRDMNDPDLNRMTIWIDALIFGARTPFDIENITNDEHDALIDLVSNFYETWRADDYADACEDLREADHTESDVELMWRFVINLFDDALDPLFPVNDMRVGNIFMRQIEALPASFPYAKSERILRSWAEGTGKDLGPLDAYDLRGLQVLQ